MTTDLNIKTLRRIAVMLLALADLAECAGGRSPAVRNLVLWLLRPGEAIARDYLATLTRAEPPATIAIPFTDDSALGCARLAASFRTLAAAIAALAIGMFTSSQPVIAAPSRSLAATGPLVAGRNPAAATERRDSS